jgi:hypothetical protein
LNIRDELLDHGRRSARKASEITGVSYSTLINWLNQGAPAGPEITSKVSRYLKIPEEKVPKYLEPPAYGSRASGLSKRERALKVSGPPQDMFNENAEDMSRAILWLLARCPDAELDKMPQAVLRDSSLDRAAKTLLTNAIITEHDRRSRAAAVKQ